MTPRHHRLPLNGPLNAEKAAPRGCRAARSRAILSAVRRLGPIFVLALGAACGDLYGGSASTTQATEPPSSSGAPVTTGGTGGVSGGTGGWSGSTGDPAGDPGDPEGPIYFAVIGDFGSDLLPEAAVAGLIAQRGPEFIITVGDNNYYDGATNTIDRNIGKYYHAFIAPYHGVYGQGATRNRFYPSPGNHDWNLGNLDAYRDFFRLPGNERYYDFRRGPVHFFSLNSDYHEPDGTAVDSAQATWLEQGLLASDAPFKVVYFHHPPYSSGYHRGSEYMRWPFRAWGADLVLTGHDHDYERLVVDDMIYIVNGVGGAALRTFNAEEVGAQRGTPDVFGALFVEADPKQMTLSLITPDGGLVDRVTLLPDPPTTWTPLIAADATWRYLQGPPPPDWMLPDAPVDTWSSGPAPLGANVGGEATLLMPGVNTYFRHVFLADEAAVGAPLRLKIAADDGAVVFLNGVEVYRINLPEGPLTPESPAVTAVGWWYEDKFAETILPGDALLAGPNLLAVELRQHSASSQDLRLAVELAAGQ